jgi:hypothetical protein
MGMMKRIMDKTTAPPFVPGSRKTGRLLRLSFCSDIANADDVEDGSLFLLTKAPDVKWGCCLATVRGWVKANDEPWQKIIAATAQTQRVNAQLLVDLDMLRGSC